MESEQKSGIEKKSDIEGDVKVPEQKDETKKVEPKPTFITQTEMLLQCKSKVELQDLFSRASPRKVCTVLGNGVAIFCDRNCYHGEYDSKADDLELIDEDVFKFEPVIAKKECVPYERSETHDLALNKLDGSPLNLMETVESLRNKIYKYTAKSNDASVRRDRPDCKYC